jgi:hypothetical protein
LALATNTITSLNEIKMEKVNRILCNNVNKNCEMQSTLAQIET